MEKFQLSYFYVVNLCNWRTLRFQKAHNEVESSISSQKEAAPSEMVTNSNNWWEEDLLKEGDEEGEDVDLEELGRALSEAGSLASHTKKQNGHTSSDTIAKDSSMKSNPRAKDSSIPGIEGCHLHLKAHFSLTNYMITDIRFCMLFSHNMWEAIHLVI